ncbi:MAG: DnaD domain protein [Clostridia bacterium]|nr:DnaD domain protein [Clostridia bacterium]
MAIEIQYGNGVVVLPEKAVRVAQNAERSDLMVLLALLSNTSLCARYGQDGGAGAVAEAAGCSEDAVRAAISFWRGAGVISVCEECVQAQPHKQVSAVQAPEKQLPKAKAPGKDGAALLKKSDDLPKYTTAELGDLLEHRPDTAGLLTECQNLFGKLFSTHEINTVLGLTDYLGLECEYVLILVTHYCSYCKQLDKRPSVRGLEKLAISLYDREITDMDALQEELLRQEALQRTEGRLRSLFGIGARALTAKEKKAFSTWLHTYSFDMEMITQAFETAADATTDVNVAYVNSILDRWNAEGIRTPDAVRADKEARDAKKSGKGKAEQPEGSFDTDDFFAAAMRKSLGENYDKIMTDEN